MAGYEECVQVMVHAGADKGAISLEGDTRLCINSDRSLPLSNNRGETALVPHATTKSIIIP